MNICNYIEFNIIEPKGNFHFIIHLSVKKMKRILKYFCLNV